jgi:DNA polymerase-3 subunit beta
MTTATLSKPRKARNGISLSTSSLKAALAAVKAAVPSRSPKPVLLNVRIGSGYVTASDLELQIQSPIDYQGDPILLPYARLQAILNVASGDEMSIEPKGQSCVVRIGSGEWTLPTESAAEFPAWQPSGIKRVCTLPAEQFCRAIRSVVYATDNETSRYALGAVLIEVERSAGLVHFVGTDGRRLAEYKAGLSSNEDPDDSATLAPARAVLAMQSIAAHSDGAVQIEATTSEVVALIDNAVVTARLVDGRFPRWRDVFPDRKAKPSTVVPEELIAATRQAAIVTSEQSKGVTYVFTPDGIHLAAQSPEAGQSSVTCNVVEFGQPATVKLDPAFVVQLLRSLDPDEPFKVEAVDANSAVTFHSGDCRAVIMPLAND